MATHGDIGLSQPAASTITMKLDTITLSANSTTVHREVMVIGSPETTNALAAIVASAPNSTEFGLVVRPVGGGVDYTHAAAVTPSTATGPAQMFRATSTTPPSVSTSDLAVWGLADLKGRQIVSLGGVFPTLQSTTILVTSTHSTAIYPIISSVASQQHKVFAYFVGSTHTTPSTLIFCSSASGSDFHHWSVNFGSGSSGMTGANMAVTPPGFIFAGLSQNALNVKVEGGSSVASTCIVRVAVSWYTE